ncbi:9022_t:CDS:2 [Diversispora eburnea]|uniref:Histone-lysine N-methyltransferase SET5 n=1 Tax=Diversispora eburnea TaxID=1213867 RepID=A0A9N8V3G1_9GLOM|nr:9022_t:CDS:2 [Diversispora eburnea]
MNKFREKGNDAFKKKNYLSAWEIYTEGLSETPTDPFLWCNRAFVNIKLEIFELGYMDALKAHNLLTSNTLPYSDSPFSVQLLKDINLQTLFIKTFKRMADSIALFGIPQRATTILETLLSHSVYSKFITKNIDKQNFINDLENYKRKSIKSPISTINITRQEHLEKILDMGSSNFDYPWDKKRQENRCSDKNIKILQKELTPYLRYIPEGTAIWNEKVFLVVHPYTIPRCHHCARRIRGENREHLKAPPNFKCENTNCNEIFCSRNCYKLANSQYHVPLCGKNLQSILSLIRQGKSGNNDKNPLMLLKLFAMAKIQNISPLNISILKYLTQFHPTKFSSSIINTSTTFPAIFFDYYLETLNLLDISLYDIKYDFWIYVTLFNILRVNVFGSPGYLCLYRFMSLINHSCLFNTIPHHATSNDEDRILDDYNNDNEVSENNMVMITSRDIQQGEQILSTYCDPNINKVQRGMVLIPTYGFECDCEKCKNEDPSDMTSLYSIPLWLIKTSEE